MKQSRREDKCDEWGWCGVAVRRGLGCRRGKTSGHRAIYGERWREMWDLSWSLPSPRWRGGLREQYSSPHALSCPLTTPPMQFHASFNPHTFPPLPCSSKTNPHSFPSLVTNDSLMINYLRGLYTAAAAGGTDKNKETNVCYSLFFHVTCCAVVRVLVHMNRG